MQQATQDKQQHSSTPYKPTTSPPRTTAQASSSSSSSSPSPSPATNKPPPLRPPQVSSTKVFPRDMELRSKENRPASLYSPVLSHQVKRQMTSATGAPLQEENINDSNVAEMLEEKLGKPGREAFHNFFYPPSNKIPTPSLQESTSSPRNSSLKQQRQPSPSSSSSRNRNTEWTYGHQDNSNVLSRNNLNRVVPLSAASAPQQQLVCSPDSHQTEFDDHFRQQEQDDQKFVSDFWHLYDDLIMLSLFTQLGIAARLGSSLWFSFFDTVFSNESALFVNLPLNCLSCFLLGILCSGESCMEVITTRFTPPKLQQQIQTDKIADVPENDDDELNNGIRNGNSMEDDQILSPTNSLKEVGSASSHTPNSSHGSASIGFRSSEDSGDAFFSSSGSQRNSYGGGLFPRLRRGRGTRRSKYERQPRRLLDRIWQPPAKLNEELREVQLLALERRIRRSKCLLLFSAQKEDVDVMEHYFVEGYKKRGVYHHHEQQGPVDHEIFEDEMDGLYLEESHDHHDVERHAVDNVVRKLDLDYLPSTTNIAMQQQISSPTSRELNSGDSLNCSDATITSSMADNLQMNSTKNTGQAQAVELHGEVNHTDLNQIVHQVSANVSENVSRLRRVNLANGWDVGTTADDMSDDIILGLRFGFCGALSSFSSWNSAMINLIRKGKIGDALIGYMLGFQLPIISYRFGQHLAVYIFVWKCRRETKQDERRGYGIQLQSERDDDDEHDENHHDGSNNAPSHDCRPEAPRDAEDRQTPSIRAIITVLFVMAVVAQCTSISYYSEPQNQLVALSLLCSPLGVLARWRLSKYNDWRPTFPIGTFACNMLACALSGGLGRLLAGNPNEELRLVLMSLINGFGGTLSSVANFIVEILAGMDPVLFRFDGAIYALWSIGCAMVIGFLFSASADWADETG